MAKRDVSEIQGGTAEDLQQMEDQKAIDDARIMGGQNQDDDLRGSSELVPNPDFSLLEDVLPEHDHIFRRGLLPGGKYIKTCRVDGCGLTEPVEFAEWNTISDR